MLATSIVMIVFGVFGKVGAIFVAIPEPIIGGVFLTLFGEFLCFLMMYDYIFLFVTEVTLCMDFNDKRVQVNCLQFSWNV